MNKLYRVEFYDTTYDEDDKLLISASDLEECKTIAQNHDWNICRTKNGEKRFKNLVEQLKSFSEADLNKEVEETGKIISIFEVENKSGILLISNIGG